VINWFAPYVDLAADVASFPLRLGMWAMEGRKDGRERERRGERKTFGMRTSPLVLFLYL
jgi:hypothetical protein